MYRQTTKTALLTIIMASGLRTAHTHCKFLQKFVQEIQVEKKLKMLLLQQTYTIFSLTEWAAWDKGQEVLTGSLSACAGAVAIESQTTQQKTEVDDNKSIFHELGLKQRVNRYIKNANITFISLQIILEAYKRDQRKECHRNQRKT